MISIRYSILRRDLTILASYLLLAFVFTYPLITQLSAFGPGHGVDDPAQTWALWWFRFATFDLGVSPLTSNYVFYPIGINLEAYTPTFLNGLISIPLQFAFGVVSAQNLVVLFSLVTSGYGTYLLVSQILARLNIPLDFKRTLAATLAGAFYAFGAWHINYVVAGHFMLLSNEWIPFFALYLLRWDRSAWQSGALAGLFFVLATWTELTFAPFLALLTLLYLIYQIVGQRFGSSKSEKRKASAFILGLPKSVVLSFVGMSLVGVIGISPLVINLFAEIQRYGYYLASGVARIQIFSAEPISFFFPSVQHPFLGAWANAITNANTSYAFIGYAALLLVSIGFWWRREAREVRFWSIAAMLCALLMLGPTLIVGGQSTGIPMPFAILRAIPFVNANRYPVRFNVMLMLSLAPLIALGAYRLLQSLRGSKVLGILAVLLAFEQLVLPIPLSDMRVPPVFQSIRDEPGDFSVLEIPLGWRGSISMQGKLDDHAQFFQTVHHKRLLGGITSRVPAWKFQYFIESPVINSLIALEAGNDVDDNRRALDQLAAPEIQRFFDVRYVDVNRALTSGAVMQYVAETFPLTEIYRDDTRTLYRVGAPPVSGNTIRVGLEPTNIYFDDRWGRAQSVSDGSQYRWATQSESGIWLPLAQRAQTVTFRLRGARARQELIVRANGQFVAEIQLSDQWENYPVPIPVSVLRDGLAEFTFITNVSPIGASRWDEYSIGDTGIVSPVDISVTGAGFDAGRFGEIWVTGQNRIESKRGYHLVAVNPQTGAVDRVGAFDTFADAAASARLAQFVDTLPPGEIVAGVAIDEVSSNLLPIAIDALHSIGAEGDLRFQFRMGQAFIGVKGAPPGQALERVAGRLPANVAVGKNVAGDRAAFALMRIEFDQ